MSEKSQAVLDYLKKNFQEASCTLLFHNDFECLVAILLSAQTTDASVNKVTPFLFSHFKTPEELSKASIEEVEKDLHSLGMYRTKAKNLLLLSKILLEKYQGQVPKNKEELISLPGVGNKTAGVFLLERAGISYLPVDTHITRVAIRLGYASKNENPMQIEAKLEKSFPRSEWIFLHHALIAFGRTICLAKNPKCAQCSLQKYCRYFKKTASTTGK